MEPGRDGCNRTFLSPPQKSSKGTAIFTNAGRTVFQEQAPLSHRARVLSVYRFGFMGAAGLIGAPLSGVVVERFGPLTTCAIASCAMMVVVACVFLFTNATRVE